MHVRRQSKSGFRFLLELQIQRGQSRAEAERSRRQQHVLNRWIDGRTGGAGRGAAFEAKDDPGRGLMNVRGQIFRSVQQPQKSLPAGARGRFTPDRYRGAIYSSPCSLVQGPDCLLDAMASSRALISSPGW
jgi:hypothetical protein